MQNIKDHKRGIIIIIIVIKHHHWQPNAGICINDKDLKLAQKHSNPVGQCYFFNTCALYIIRSHV